MNTWIIIKLTISIWAPSTGVLPSVSMNTMPLLGQFSTKSECLAQAEKLNKAEVDHIAARADNGLEDGSRIGKSGNQKWQYKYGCAATAPYITNNDSISFEVKIK